MDITDTMTGMCYKIHSLGRFIHGNILINVRLVLALKEYTNVAISSSKHNEDQYNKHTKMHYLNSLLYAPLTQVYMHSNTHKNEHELPGNIPWEATT